MKSHEDEEVCSYDDLSVATSPAGRVILRCPTCGLLPIPWRETTLSDLTNAALEHLLEVHPGELTLALGRRTSDSASAAPVVRRTNLEVEQFSVDHFWSLIELLGPLGAAGDIEALVRGLAALTEDLILAFHHQLMTAVAALDTPDHANQEVIDVDHPQPGMSPTAGDVFLPARVAVVAAGREVYSSVLTEPVKLAGGWPLRAAQLVLNAAPTAFARVTGHSWASYPARALPGRATAAEPAKARA